jgi:hypothetical protein
VHGIGSRYQTDIWLEGLRKSISVSIVSGPAEIQTEHLPNTSQSVTAYWSTLVCRGPEQYEFPYILFI